MLTSLNKNIMPLQCRGDNLTLIWSDVSSKKPNELCEGKAQCLPEVGFPKDSSQCEVRVDRGIFACVLRHAERKRPYDIRQKKSVQAQGKTKIWGIDQ